MLLVIDEELVLLYAFLFLKHFTHLFDFFLSFLHSLIVLALLLVYFLLHFLQLKSLNLKHVVLLPRILLLPLGFFVVVFEHKLVDLVSFLSLSKQFLQYYELFLFLCEFLPLFLVDLLVHFK